VQLDSGLALAHDGHSDSELVMTFASTEAEPNLYHATLPRAWVYSPGELRLVIFTSVPHVSNSTRAVTLTVALNVNSFSVSMVVGPVIGVGLSLLLLCLVRILRRNWAAAKETLKAYMKFEFRLGVEMSAPLSCFGHCRTPALHVTAVIGFIAGVDVWDLAGDTYVVMKVHESRSALALWYGNAAIGSCALCTHRAALKVLHVLRPRSLRVSVHALHEGEAVDV
jgi:hypothetical protein